MKTTTYANALLAVKRGTALGYPATQYWALLKASKGARASSTAYALNDTVAIIPTGKTTLQLYKCTTGGTTAASQGTLYPGMANEVITDGTAVFTEQTSALQAGTAQSEPTIGTNAYARLAITGNVTNWAAASGGSIANAGSAWAWPTATPAGWTTGAEAIWGVGCYDAASAGICWEVEGLTAVAQISANATPALAAGQLTVTEA